MKKLIAIEIVILVLLLTAVGYFTFSEVSRRNTDIQEFPKVPSENLSSVSPEESTAEPTEEPTEPPTEAPTEPPVVVELADSWIPLLYGKEISASHYFVYDCNSNAFLLNSGSATEPIYPASVTKLFSAYVALQYIDPAQEVIAGSSLGYIDPDSSTAGLLSGDALTAEQMVAGMLLCSGNDATYALASDVGRIVADDQTIDTATAIKRFVEQMNTTAGELGLKNSHFVTPDGIHDENHYVCAQDLVTIARLAMEDPILSKYVGLAKMDVTTSGRTLNWKNSNKLLHEDLDFYCEYATGLKTGYTGAAGNCLISSFRIGSRDLLIGVFGSPEQDGRYVDTLLLFAQTFGLEIPEPEVPTDTLVEEPVFDEEIYDEAA
ncbi:MAG: D-alanyl-D-alanine carboxypeptidase [Oscillospiraceae bacterium]|nr:D-alanyl-D-alanine carboxypeptidase [Oscillospiraceae bacterium]